MRYTKSGITTTKNTPKDAEIISHKLMIRSGMIKKLASGLYTWMPLGLKVIKKIENMLGRKKSRIKNMPRTIDIDILVHGSSIMETKELIIPHPGLINRKFVLIPFDEIATDFKIPHINMTVNELLVRCTDKAFVKLYELENKA